MPYVRFSLIFAVPMARTSPASRTDLRLNAKFGEVLRRKREAANLSQTKLAQDADVARTTIVKIESGEEGVRLFLLYRLAKALGIHPRDLLPDPSVVTPVAGAESLRKSTGGATRDILMEELNKKAKDS